MNPKKKIALFLVLTLVLTTAFALVRPKQVVSEFETKHLWTYKTHTTNTYDFVFYGDSRLYRGVSPDTVLYGTDYTGYNFGYSSGSISQQMLDHLDKHLDKTSSPTVVLAITPYCFTQNSLKDLQFVQERDRNPWDIFERYYLSNYMAVFDRITPEEVFGLVDMQTIEVCSPDGSIISDNYITDIQDGIDNYRKVFDNNPIDSTAMQNLFDQISTWRDSGVRVVGFRPPTFTGMEQIEFEESGFVEAPFVEDFMNSGGEWLYVNKDGYKTYDGSHLKMSEAYRFSNDLGKLLGLRNE